MYFCSMENDMMSNGFFPIFHFIIIYFLLLTKGNYDLTWNKSNMDVEKKFVLEKMLETASDCINSQFL